MTGVLSAGASRVTGKIIGVSRRMRPESLVGAEVGWWDRAPGDRAQWVLDPLAGVGPLRFGMSPQQVREALEGTVAYVSQGLGEGVVWEYYDEPGLTVFYGPGPRLVAVAIDAVGGPLVRLGEVELVARVPSEARADLHRLSRSQKVVVRVNHYGEPEVPAWGLSVRVEQEWGHAPEGYKQRRDAMITSVLVTGPELAEAPWDALSVAKRYGSSAGQAEQGPWPVTADQHRPRWECTPLRGVGPLRFGMGPEQVMTALDGEVPADRRGYHPFPAGAPWAGDGDPEEWHLAEERYDRAGVSAHYWHEENGPVLSAVTVHGRTGPQVLLDGIELIGREPSAVGADLIRYIEEHRLEMRYSPTGNLGSTGINVWVQAERAGDTTVSGAQFCIEQWEYSD
ncbi:hypothetical protein [Kitasatospora sp. NPDC057223]|uniref:hypothetical protein n=1 Tax=Kitasatospora sp. NPDC057223 TaxID=3346055 RepID=UPI003628CF81